MILVFDLGVLVLALYGQTWACSIMALIVFIINSCAFLFPQGEFVGLSIKIVPGILFAAVPSYLVYFLSELISNKRERAEEEQRVFVSIEERQRLKHELAETQAQLAALKAPPMPIQSLEAAPLLPTSSLPASYPQGFSKQMQVDNNIQDSELPEQGTMLPGEQIQPKESGRMWSIEGKSKRARKNKYQRWQADIQGGETHKWFKGRFSLPTRRVWSSIEWKEA